MKIGVTSQNYRTITGHAGKSRRFLVFETSDSGEVNELERIDLPWEMVLHNFRGDNHPIFELDIIVTGSCGQGFINRLASHHVQVILTRESDPLATVDALVAGQPIEPPVPHSH